MNTEENLNPYDADATQKILIGGNAFAAVKPYTDEKYLANQKEFAEDVNKRIASGADNKLSEDDIKANLIKDCELADELISALEGIEDLPEDWKDLVAPEDKVSIVKRAINFIIDDEENEGISFKNLLKIVVPTASYFNNIVSQQTHTLRRKTIDDSSAYAYIASKSYNPKKATKFGQKDYVEIVPQDEAKGRLYDEMLESVDGFVNNKVPLRVKVLVIDHVFKSTIGTGKK